MSVAAFQNIGQKMGSVEWGVDGLICLGGGYFLSRLVEHLGFAKATFGFSLFNFGALALARKYPGMHTIEREGAAVAALAIVLFAQYHLDQFIRLDEERWFSKRALGRLFLGSALAKGAFLIFYRWVAERSVFFNSIADYYNLDLKFDKLDETTRYGAYLNFCKNRELWKELSPRAQISFLVRYYKKGSLPLTKKNFIGNWFSQDCLPSPLNDEEFLWLTHYYQNIAKRCEDKEAYKKAIPYSDKPFIEGFYKDALKNGEVKKLFDNDQHFSNLMLELTSKK